MALPKIVRDSGGSFYKGYRVVIGAGLGDTQLDMIISNTGHALNGVIVTCTETGDGDYYKLEHFNSAGNPLDPDGFPLKNSGILAETIFNKGGGVAQQFDFVSLELFYPGDILRFTYTNVAGVAMDVIIDTERIK